MPRFDTRIVTVLRTLENGLVLGEALFWPEIMRVGSRAKRVRQSVGESVRKLLEYACSTDPDAVRRLWERRVPFEEGALGVGMVEIRLQPPRRSESWRDAVVLRFHTLSWQQAPEVFVAALPELAIEVLGRSEEERTAALEREIRGELQRREAAGKLHKLAMLQRVRQLDVQHGMAVSPIPTPEEVREPVETAERSVVSEVATPLHYRKLPEAFEREAEVRRLGEALGGQHPRSVLLVGPSGCGKTAIVYELVRTRSRYHLGRTPFYETSGARLVAGQIGFGMWQERCQKLVREVNKSRAVLVLGNLVELCEVGRSVSNTQGMASFLRPFLLRGALQAIVECTPEQLRVIERNEPNLLDAFVIQTVEEPDEAQTMAILAAVVLAESGTPRVDDNELRLIHRLHRRHATYSVSPGRPIRFLRQILQTLRDEGEERITRTFSEETGLPMFLLDDRIALNLQETHAWFSSRVQGQPEAVNLVVDLLATTKARLSRPNRPLLSMMLIGPTGVGKTELARALSEFFYSDKTRMVRFDMSEYADPISVQRLVGGLGQAEGLLVAQVREHPFGVVLFDEVEKADAQFFDLLLQMLGEGRLTDAAGRVADFRNTVILMTSNLGARSFMQGHIGIRASHASREAMRSHFVQEVQNHFRPELFNRIDRIVPFAPLDSQTVQSLSQRELELLQKRDGLQYRDVVVQVAPQLTRLLAERGYHPQYGARPLKRAIEREILVPLADELNRYDASVPLDASLTVQDGKPGVTVRTRQPTGSLDLAQDPRWREHCHRVVEHRRNVQRLLDSTGIRELANEVSRLKALERRLRKGGDKGAEEMRERVARLPRLQTLLNSVTALGEAAVALEEDALMVLYGHRDRPTMGGDDLVAAAQKYRDRLLTMYSSQYERPDEGLLAVYSENRTAIVELGTAYRRVLEEWGGTVTLYRIEARRKPNEAEDEQETVLHKIVKSWEGPMIGLLLEVRQAHAWPRIELEGGLHIMMLDRLAWRCFVDAANVELKEYRMPAGIHRKGVIGRQQKRRTFIPGRRTVEDSVLGDVSWPHDDMVGIIRRLMDGALIQAAEEALLS